MGLQWGYCSRRPAVPEVQTQVLFRYLFHMKPFPKPSRVCIPWCINVFEGAQPVRVRADVTLLRVFLRRRANTADSRDSPLEPPPPFPSPNNKCSTLPAALRTDHNMRLLAVITAAVVLATAAATLRKDAAAGVLDAAAERALMPEEAAAQCKGHGSSCTSTSQCCNPTTSSGGVNTCCALVCKKMTIEECDNNFIGGN